MRKIKIEAKNVASEVKFFEYIGFAEPQPNRSPYIEQAITHSTYYRMGTSNRSISPIIMKDLEKRVMSHLMFCRSSRTADASISKIEVSEEMYSNIVNALKALQEKGLFTSFTVSIITKEHELLEEIASLKETISKLEKIVDSKYTIRHIQTRENNFLVKIENKEEIQLFYSSPEGTVLRQCDPNPTEVFWDTYMRKHVEERRETEWEWATSTWDSPIEEGLPYFSPASLEGVTLRKISDLFR